MTFIDVSQSKKRKFLITKADTFLFFLFNVSGRIAVDIRAKNAKVYIFGVFLGKNKEVFHLETIQHHLAPETFSDLLIKGAFFDQSKFLYHGLIRIEKKAQAVHAFQKNQNLMMSKNAFVSSQPDLEIEANDVFCTHGSTTGKLDKDQLFYLKSRGLEQKQAKKLLVQGFLGEVFEKIKALGDFPEINEHAESLQKRLSHS